MRGKEGQKVMRKESEESEANIRGDIKEKRAGGE